MKKLPFCIGIGAATLLLTVFFPGEVFASANSFKNTCLAHGYTVVFINGSFDTLEKAQANAAALELLLDGSYKAEPLTVTLAYNPIHLAGVGDLAESISQMLFSPVSNYDFNDLLRQLSQKDTTQKLLLVGHSQGALYANSIYDYLTAGGKVANSFGLYAVATPANYVAGGGAYINSNEDAVIYIARVVAEQMKAPVPLPSNADLPGSLAIADLPKTHQFLTYAHSARDRVKSDINHELGFLKSESKENYPCVTPPPQSFSDVTQQALFMIADPLATAAMEKFLSTYKDIAGAVIHTLTIAQGVQHILGAAVSALFGQTVKVQASPLSPQTQEKGFGFVKKLYGSSLNQEIYEELNSDQGAAVALASTPTIEATTTTVIFASSISNGPEYVYSGGTALPPPQVESVENVIASTSPPVEDSPTSTTPILPTEVPQTATTTTATTSPFTPQHSPISDTFDAFNSHGWQTFGQNVKNFDFDDGEDGECRRKGCAVGMGGNVYDTLVPRMYIQTGPGLESGAYTLYAKARAGFNNPFPVITVCAAGYSACTDSGATKGINFMGMIPLDDTWHHYYFAWKQDGSFVQSCFMQDYHHFSDCVWVDTGFPAGTTFDGVALWSTNGWRADVSTHANLWFDELKAQ